MGLIAMSNTQQKGMRDLSHYKFIFQFNDAIVGQNRLSAAPSLFTIELDKDIAADGHASETSDSILHSHVYKRLSYSYCKGKDRTYV